MISHWEAGVRTGTLPGDEIAVADAAGEDTHSDTTRLGVDEDARAVESVVLVQEGDEPEAGEVLRQPGELLCREGTAEAEQARPEGV